MLATADGQVWVGGTNGLVRVANGHSERFDWVKAPGMATRIPVQVYSLLPDGENGVLVGGKHALFRWDGTGLRWLSSFPLTIHLARDRSGTLWAGTPLDIRRQLRTGTQGMPDTGLDWISNGVIDLVPDKDAVFDEIDRVLRPGGRLQVADVVIHHEVSEDARKNIDLWTG